MGKRRRKLLRRKYAKLPWNKYYKLHPNEDTQKEQMAEQKIAKVVDDNSVMLEQMKSMSSTLDKVLQNIDYVPEPEIIPTKEELSVAVPEVKAKEPEIRPTNKMIVEPQFLSTEPPPIIEKPTKLKDLNKMLKKDLFKMAQEMGCNINPKATKANIIKAIQAA